MCLPPTPATGFPCNRWATLTSVPPTNGSLLLPAAPSVVKTAAMSCPSTAHRLQDPASRIEDPCPVDHQRLYCWFWALSLVSRLAGTGLADPRGAGVDQHPRLHSLSLTLFSPSLYLCKSACLLPCIFLSPSPLRVSLSIPPFVLV